jgi:hypothetical protein
MSFRCAAIKILRLCGRNRVALDLITGRQSTGVCIKRGGGYRKSERIGQRIAAQQVDAAISTITELISLRQAASR